jgi:hypothetical protein
MSNQDRAGFQRCWFWAVLVALAAATFWYVVDRPADASYFIGWACFAELRQMALSLEIREADKKEGPQ